MDYESTDKHCAKAETLIWYKGEAFCGICYYFNIQHKAEESMMAERKAERLEGDKK